MMSEAEVVGDPLNVRYSMLCVHPVADRLHALRAVGDLAEVLEGEIQQLVRIAVAARQRVAQHAVGQLFDGHGRAEAVRVFRRGRHPDQRIVA